jgi:hypothetical protein
MGIECCLSGVAMANGLENRKLEARVALVVRGFAARMRLGERCSVGCGANFGHVGAGTVSESDRASSRMGV